MPTITLANIRRPPGIKPLSLLAMLASLSACVHGVLSIPPATFTYYENLLGTGRAISVVSNGLVIDTNADAGITLGHSQKTYFFEGQNSHRLSGDYFAPLLGKTSEKPSNEGNPYTLRAKTLPETEMEIKKPVAYSTASVGLIVNTNQHRLGLIVGANHYDRLFLPREFDGIVFIHLENHPAPQRIFSIEKEVTKCPK